MHDVVCAFAVKLNWRLTNTWFTGSFEWSSWCVMAMSTVGPIIFANNTIAAINFLKSKGLLASSMNCMYHMWSANELGYIAQLVPVRMGGIGDALTVRHTRPSELDHSLVSPKLSLQKWIHLMHLWSISMPVITACKEAEVASKTAIDVYQWLKGGVQHQTVSNPN